MIAISGFPTDQVYGFGDSLGGFGLGAAQGRLGLPGMGAAGVSPTQQATQQNLQLLLMLLGLMQGSTGTAQSGGTNGAGASPSGGANAIGAAQSGGASATGASQSGGANATGAAANSAGAGGGAGTGELKADASGKVKPEELKAYLEQRIASSKLNGYKPKDGAKFGVDGSAQSWAAFMTKLAEKESSFSTKTVGDVGDFRGGSRGLFQLSYDDAKNYGLNGGKPFSAEQLADPKVNVDAAVTIMETLVLKSGSIAEGGGKYWGPIRRGWSG